MRRVLTVWLALGTVAMGVGCDDGTTPATDGGVVDMGDALVPDMAQIEPDPPFNYIPLNDEACKLDTKAPGVQQVVHDQTLELLRTGRTWADNGFEMCTETPLNNCPGCTAEDNNFLQMLRDIDGMGFTSLILGEDIGNQVDQGLPEAGLVGYVQQALNYPYRKLVATVSRCDDLPRGQCPELCWNGGDEDRDGLVDCDDPDCEGSSRCTVGEVCDDDMDNDGDGTIDCADLECWDHVGCVPENCTNGVDDDGNGQTDCGDWQCEGDFACGAVPARVTLTQGARQPCEDGNLQCGHYSIEPESFDLSCSQFSLRFYGRVGPVVDMETGMMVPDAERFKGRLFRDAVEDVTLGFVVPLVNSAELPRLDPPLTDAELENWLELLESNDKRLDARLRDPELDLRLDNTADSGCGKLEGRIEPDFIDQFLEGEDEAASAAIKNLLVPRYQDLDYPGSIPVILSFSLEAGSFTSGATCKPNPCFEASGVCDGDVLSLTEQDDICIQPRPAGFTTGDDIEPQCQDGPTYQADVDCAAFGGTCDAPNASCDPAWRTPQVGDIVINEVFVEANSFNPGLEWVEIKNVADVPLRLNDCRFQGRDTTYGERESLTGFDPILMAPGQLMIVARVLNPEIPRTEQGLDVDIPLVAEDSVALTDEGRGDVFRVLCPGPDGKLEPVDRVSWQGVSDVASWSLDPGSQDAEGNDDRANWCDATDAWLVYGERQLFGTPGAENSPCP